MNLMNAMMLSCVKATQLMELRQQSPLSLMQKIQLQMHLSMCSGCRNYMKQTKLIDKVLGRTFETTGIANTDDLEAIIISKIQ
ncbi:MAG: hypothetical protein ABIN36_16990 [Ferruginibacter sp.]